MTTARRWQVIGRVQGVGFRAFVMELARNEGVVGYVRNLADGRVETVAAGDSQSMNRVEQGLRKGPPLARVETLIVEDINTVDLPSDFVVRSSEMSR